MKVAINGFGRIGRNTLRALIEEGFDGIEIVAVNDLSPPETQCHLLKYDSVHGRLKADVALQKDKMIVNGQSIRMTSHKNPEDLPWDDIDIVYECTGKFKNKENASRYLKSGSKRVLVSAPGTGADKTVVYGVNHHDISASDAIISAASCTTNCLAPVAKVLHDSFGIETGYMTTVHAYTGDQPTHDTAHKDLHRARAAALSMIPTTTGAARALALVLPQLEGRLEGSAVRVPTANVSLVDLAVVLKTPTDADAVNAAMQTAADGPMKGILSYETDPLVSVDFNHDTHSSCFAAGQTTVTKGGMVRVVSWYDNEWGFCNRMNDLARFMGRFI